MRNGFSLIELMLVTVIIGIMIALGVVGYQNYVTESKNLVVEANSETVNRALDGDYIAIKNNLARAGGITPRRVTRTDFCWDYANELVGSIVNTDMANAFDAAQSFPVNLHRSENHSSGRGQLRFGQIGFICADPCARIGDADFYMMHCTCTQTGDTLDDADGYEADGKCILPPHNASVYIGEDRNIGGNIVVTGCTLNNAADISSGCTASSLRFPWDDPPGTRQTCPTPIVADSISCP